MQNLAGHTVSLFLFRFEIQKTGISFVLNEAIAEDLYPNIEKKIKPLTHACCETLSRYSEQCKTDVIMDGNLLEDGEFEVMLSQGLGIHFIPFEKKSLFSDAYEVAQLLIEVMDKRTKEIEAGEYHSPQPVIHSVVRSGEVDQGLEELGIERKDVNSVKGDFPELPLLLADDLPDGVRTRVSYDHRGDCQMFLHEKCGTIGKIVLVNDDVTLKIAAELCKENPEYFEYKKGVLDEVVNILELKFLYQSIKKTSDSNLNNLGNCFSNNS